MTKRKLRNVEIFVFDLKVDVKIIKNAKGEDKSCVFESIGHSW